MGNLAAHPAARRASRLTGAGLILVFAVTIYFGALLVAFDRLENRIWFATPSLPLARVTETVSQWTSTPLVSQAAISLLLDVLLVETPHDATAIEQALDHLAAISPASSSTWQALAEVRKARSAPMETVLAAFRMSELTGSHEGYAIMRRVVFGLEHWSDLPESDQHTVIRELLATAGPTPLGAERRYRTVLATKSEAERAGIKGALADSGLATEDLLRRLGV